MRRRWSVSLCGVWIALVGLMWSVDAQALTLPQLMERLQAVPGLSAGFKEEKHIALLAAPLVSEGRVYFAPPHRLARLVERPKASALIIDKDRLFMGEEGKRKRIDLGKSPVVRAFVSSFLKLLAGDLEALRSIYEVRFEAKDAKTWHLELSPKKAPITKIIKTMRFYGRGVIVDRLEIDEMSGDKTVTTFEKVDPQRSFSKTELEKIFGGA